MDVEHWRPKSEVHEADGSVLVNQSFFRAADGENLMPSCIDCNRIRTHEVIFPDLSRRRLNLGKGTRFPIAGKRATDRLSLVSEDPLLLSPFTDDPTQHLEFIREGVVRAKSGTKSLKSEHSIEVYALNRVGLVNERYERILLIQKYIHTIRR